MNPSFLNTLWLSFSSKKWVILGSVLLAICLIVKLLFARYFQFHFDDAFISFRVTEVFAKTGVPSFFTNVPTFTSTSILYPVWNSLCFFLFNITWPQKVAYLNLFIQAVVFARIAWLLLPMAKSRLAWFCACLCVSALSFSPAQWVVANTGLETCLFQFVVAFCVLPRGRLWLGWFGVFVRPDGFLAGLSSAIHEWFTFRRKSIFYQHLFFGLGALVLWCIVTFYWFNTIIPQSIMAKSNHDIVRINQLTRGFEYLFMQDYGVFSLLIGSSLYMFPESRAHFSPMLLWCLLYTLFYSLLASWWAWYVPPLLVPLFYMSGHSVLKWIEYLENWKPAWIKLIFLSILVLFFVEFRSAYAKLSIDGEANAIRIASSKHIGTWLTDHVDKLERVLLEPLGMISYFAPTVRFLDYPGLTCPEMSEFLRKLPWKIPIQLTEVKTNQAVVDHFQPEWIIVFPYELEAMKAVKDFELHYTLKHTMNYYPNHERFKEAYIFRRNKTW